MKIRTVASLILVLLLALSGCTLQMRAERTPLPVQGENSPALATATSTGSLPPIQSQPSQTPSETSDQPMLTLDKNYFCNHGPGSNYLDVIDFPEGTVLPIIGKDGSGWWLVRIHDPRTSHSECWIGGGIVSGSIAAVPIVLPGPFVPVHNGLHWSEVVYLDCTHLVRYTWVFGGESSGEFVATEPILGFTVPTVKYEEWMPVCPSFSP